MGHDGPYVDGIAVPVQRGSVLVLSSRLMHRSLPNVTDRLRRAWILQYCGAAAASALFTLPRAVWERHLRPGAQIVPHTAMHLTGSVSIDGSASRVEATGGLARILGHRSAQRWG